MARHSRACSLWTLFARQLPARETATTTPLLCTEIHRRNSGRYCGPFTLCKFLLHSRPFIVLTPDNSPAEVFQMPSTQLDVVRFIHLARIAHKYSFRTTENWALHVLTVCQTNSDIMPKANSTPILTQLTEVAVLCNHEELHEAVEPMWADLLFTGQTEDIISAMTVADKLNLRPLLGLAYYLMMLKGRDEWKNPNLKSALTREQTIRLLSGYYNISRACEALPANAPTLVHHPTCFMQGRCSEAWQSIWTTMIFKMMSDGGSTTLRIQNVDLLRKLHLANHLLEKLLSGDATMDIPVNMNKSCLRNGLKASEDKVNDVLYGLADCFVALE